jgi:hypothetical protein
MIAISRFAKLLARAGDEAKIGFKVHPHMLRHACGYALANKGIDTRTLEAYLGHCSINSTTRYAARLRDGLGCQPGLRRHLSVHHRRHDSRCVRHHQHGGDLADAPASVFARCAAYTQAGVGQRELANPDIPNLGATLDLIGGAWKDERRHTVMRIAAAAWFHPSPD